jgi:hypothetical protein
MGILVGGPTSSTRSPTAYRWRSPSSWPCRAGPFTFPLVAGATCGFLRAAEGLTGDNFAAKTAAEQGGTAAAPVEKPSMSPHSRWAGRAPLATDDRS